jgi:hypothetical protein
MFVQGSIGSTPLLAERPGLVFVVAFGLVIVLLGVGIVYFVRRMGR